MKSRKGVVDALVIGVLALGLMFALNWGKPLGVVEKGTGTTITGLKSGLEMTTDERIEFELVSNPYSEHFR